MQLNELRLFLHLSKSLHFGNTSRECHLSPSALSRTIQRLEEEMGTPLFIRDKRSVRLTEAGGKFRVYARETIDGWEHLQNSLAEEELQGELILYGSVTAAYGVLSNLFAMFRDLHPNIHLRLETGDSAQAIAKVVDRTADVAVAARPVNLPKNLLFRTITTTPLTLIGPVVPCEVTSLIRKNPVPWESVPLILAEQALSRRRVEDWYRSRGIRANVYAEVAGHEAILSMVRLGCGVGAVPGLVIENSIFKDEVQIVPINPPLPAYEVGLCVHRSRLTSPVVRAFWESA